MSAAAPGGLDELILYATPEGEFGRACHRYWDELDRSGRRTTAQTFPPHCTLTGFFHRAPSRVPAVIDDVSQVVEGAVHVESHRLEQAGDWLGFELVAPEFDRVIARLVAAHGVEHGEDGLRAKTWLHLSLAYGEGSSPEHLDVARTCFDGVDPAAWSVGLWRRRSGCWELLTPAPADHADR